MDFDWVRFHETVLRSVRKNLFVGIGYHLDLYSNIVDKKLDIAAGQFTNHYNYSLSHGFDPAKYSLSSVSANLVYDSRDNQINPYKGLYVNLQYRNNPDFLGSTKSSGLTWVEIRAFKGVSKSKPRHLIVGWAFASFASSGTVPYLGLPAANYDMRNRSARAYVQGRFRGEEMVYAEAEYRFPISKCTSVLGGVLFVNGITTSDRENKVRVFDYTKAGYGAGLRIAVDKLSRTNIAIDVGFGEHSTGIYFGAAEDF